MKTKFYVVAMAALTVACSSENKDIILTDESEPMVQKELKSLEFDYMDTTESPANDFYQFANGAWLVDNPIPEEESRWSSFNVLDNRNNDILNGIIENAMEN